MLIQREILKQRVSQGFNRITIFEIKTLPYTKKVSFSICYTKMVDLSLHILTLILWYVIGLTLT